jgi:hypothetical protein
MQTHTKCLNFSKLARAPGAATVIRIAMVCNDLAIANESLGRYKNLKPDILSHIKQGGKLYFVRMSAGHLREGMKAIQGVKDDKALSNLVTRCDPTAQAAYAELRKCLIGGKYHQDFTRYVNSVRDKTAFHYSHEQITKALEFRDQHHSGSLCSMTIGEDIHSCRFEFADIVLDTIVCRELWNIPLAADVQEEADRISDWCFTRSLQFWSFGGDFVTRFLKEHGQ